MILRGDRVVLRPPREDDADRLLEIWDEPDVRRWWGLPSMDEVRTELIENEAAFVIEVDGTVAGAIEYSEQDDPMYRSAGIDIFLTSAARGRGLGTEAVKLLARHLFDDRGHHRLTIDPAAANKSAIRAYGKVGYREVGIMRSYERAPDGTWRDGLLMDMLRDELQA